jgi:hypothetical protein
MLSRCAVCAFPPTRIRTLSRRGRSLSFTSINLDKIHLRVPSCEDMEDVGAVLATLAGSTPGATLLLDGDLGAGKTALARGFLRVSTGISDLRVTSPTYLLSQTYRNDAVEYVVWIVG